MSQTIASDRATKVDHYLSQQLSKTGAQVRIIDLFTSAMALVAGVIGALFLMAIVDAWIIELGKVTRWICLIGLLGGSIYYIVRVIVPLMIRRINPAYAARVIESSQDSMHNGLVNYVYLRDQRGKSPHAVVNAVGNRAATDISGVVVENTVDKSHTLRAAIILTVLVVVFGIYKVLSPKDPFQTFARVLVPDIGYCQAGASQRFRCRAGRRRCLFWTAIDGFRQGEWQPQSQSQCGCCFQLRMANWSIRRYAWRPTGETDRYQCELKTGASGIEQSLNYRIVAADGRSNEYQVTLKSTPTLSVESIEYQPPAYTKLPPRKVTGSSEIEALEGTTVKVEARSNTEIKSAYIELLQELDSGDYRPVNTVSMKTEGSLAHCGFVLHVDTGRSNRNYTHYRLRFTTSDGQKNPPIAAYPIRIVPDLAPQILVIQPTEREISLPVNGSLRFQVQASDPDFEIERIEIEGLHLGASLFNKDLPLGQQDRSLQVRSQFDFRPTEFGLRPGDSVIVRMAAFDNRRSVVSDLPDPNITRSDNFTIKIEAADESIPERNDEQDSSSDQESQNADSESADDGSGDTQSSDESNQGGQSANQQSSQGDSQSDKSSQTQNQSEQESEQGGNESQQDSEQSDSGQSGSETSIHSSLNRISLATNNSHRRNPRLTIRNPNRINRTETRVARTANRVAAKTRSRILSRIRGARMIRRLIMPPIRIAPVHQLPIRPAIARFDGQ